MNRTIIGSLDYLSAEDLMKLRLVFEDYESRKLLLDLILKKTQNKLEKLLYFVEFYNYLPKQGTKDWLENRKGNKIKPPTIGGSEIFDLINHPKTLMEKKLVHNFTGNIHTFWGNLFEELIANIFDHLFKTNSYETGAIPGLVDESGNTILAYSPDRLMNVRTDIFLKQVFSEINEAKINLFKSDLENFVKDQAELIILNEFKCPSTTIPNGMIPNHYTLQPPTGIWSLKIPDLALFCNCSFRKCAIRDFNLDLVYDLNFHRKDLENNPDGFRKVLFLGMIGIYKPGKELINPDIFKNKIPDTMDLEKLIKSALLELKNYGYKTNLTELEKIIPEIIFKDNLELIKKLVFDWNFEKINILDLGEMEYITDILSKTIQGKSDPDFGYQSYYSGLFSASQTNMNPCIWLNQEILKFQNLKIQEGNEIIGILPWKLLKICMIPVFPDPDFGNKYKNHIMNFSKDLHYIKLSGLEVPESEKSSYYKTKISEKFGTKIRAKTNFGKNKEELKLIKNFNELELENTNSGIQENNVPENCLNIFMDDFA